MQLGLNEGHAEPLRPRRHKRIEDLEQAQAACARSLANTVVSAGAGSGKTTVLAARYVHLLEEGRMRDGSRVRPRNVLVLTFTRKAAAEMRSRIYGALAEAHRVVRERGESELAQHLEDCLASFAEADIGTFDAFAGKIARSGSPRFGLAPDFSVDDARTREAAEKLALEFLIEKREEPTMRDLIAANSFEWSVGMLTEIAIERMPLSSPPDFLSMHDRQTAVLKERVQELRKTLLDQRESVLELPDRGVTPKVAELLAAFRADPSGGLMWDSAPEPSSQDAEAFRLWLTKVLDYKKPGSNVTSEAGKFLNEMFDEFRKTANSYLVAAQALEDYPRWRALYSLLDEFRSRWDSRRRMEKIMSFRDTATMARDILVTDPELRAQYKRLYRYIMIDEFQDDDELQKRVLFLLAEQETRDAPRGPGPGELEPDKLFFVGDEKQSIYLFRGADVSVFRALPQELGPSSPGSKAAHHILARNFRSEPGLIELINRIFERVMRPESESGPAPYEAVFDPLSSREPTPGVTPEFRYLELPYRSDTAPELRPRAECEAWAVAEFIRDAVENGTLTVADRHTGRARRARYEDFAILFRATGKQVHFEKYLRLLCVPYASESACGFFSEAVACDFYYAWRLATHPEDRHALAAYLLSPFADLTDDAVVSILLALRKAEAANEPLIDPLSPAAAALLPDEAARRAHERGAATMAALRAMIDRASIAATASYLWYEAGYRVALLSNPAAQAFEEHFELIHSLAAKADSEGKSLAAFVASIEPLIGSPEKTDEADIPREDARGVRLMTIHKAKGLEFPVVIVPQANNTGRGVARGLWAWDDKVGLTLSLPDFNGDPKRRIDVFFEQAKALQEARLRAEVKRLLYVALTRAESHILITATAPYREEKNAARSFRSLLLPALGLEADPKAKEAAASLGATAAISINSLATDKLCELDSGARAGLIPERSEKDYESLLRRSRGRGLVAPPRDAPLVERRAAPQQLPVSQLSAAYDAEISAGGPAGHESECAALRLETAPALLPPEGLSPGTWGSLVHRMLERALRPKDQRTAHADDEPELPPSLAAELEAALPSPAARDEALSHAHALSRVFLDSPLGRRALAAPERLVEWPIALRYSLCGETRIARATIDLVIIEADRAIIVDYKTDAEFVPGRHHMQLGAYRRAAAAILSRPVEARLFYLYGGGREVLVDENAPGLEAAPIPEAQYFHFSFHRDRAEEASAAHEGSYA